MFCFGWLSGLTPLLPNCISIDVLFWLAYNCLTVGLSAAWFWPVCCLVLACLLPDRWPVCCLVVLAWY